jgi:hypothetical protein
MGDVEGARHGDECRLGKSHHDELWSGVDVVWREGIRGVRDGHDVVWCASSILQLRLKDAREDVALDELLLLACGGAKAGGGEPVGVA